MPKTKLIVNLTSGGCVCVGELADRPLSRMRGLMGRRALKAGGGLLLSPAPAIHTAFMRFSIDALFLDRDLRVLRIVERMRPWRVASKRGARAVLELSAGACAQRGLQVGDRLELRDRTSACVADSALRDAANTDTVGPLTPVRRLERRDLARLQPLRILVISPDRHFRTVISLLLARRNCSVSVTGNTSRVPSLIARESADILVIEANGPVAAMVESLSRPVGVVLIADEARDTPPDPPVLAKWGSFGDLVAAIELADERRLTLADSHDSG